MENREQQILSEIKLMMASIRSQLEKLDAKMAELQQAVDPEEFASEVVDLELDIIEPENLPEDLPEVLLSEDLPEATAAPEIPEIITIAEKTEEEAKLTINDAQTVTYAWRKDMTGSPVRDIRSAISLNDRVIFINNLFNEDAQTFVNALMQINAMGNLDQVVEYVTAQFPEWDMNSELVYRFMMAVRRKIQ